MDERYYTVAEANALLPEVRHLLEQLRSALQSLQALRLRMGPADQEIVKPEADTAVAPEHFSLITMFHASVSRFQSLNIQIKDVQSGLIDFPAKSGGQNLLLCWKEGEDAVRYFHDLEAGFSGRRPIEELPELDAGDDTDS